jgi:RimJ/RimL family protein N-acetyltransferase
VGRARLRQLAGARDGDAVGRAGLWWTLVEGRAELELGWVVHPDRWGEGIATEFAAEVVRLAGDELGVRRLVAFTLPHNTASRRVMEKIGLTFERDITHAGLPHVLYATDQLGGAKNSSALPSGSRKDTPEP